MHEQAVAVAVRGLAASIIALYLLHLRPFQVGLQWVMAVAVAVAVEVMLEMLVAQVALEEQAQRQRHLQLIAST